MQLLSCSEESCNTIHTHKNNIIKENCAIRSFPQCKKIVFKSSPFPFSHKNSRGLSQFKLLSSDTVWFLKNSSIGLGLVIRIQKNKTRFILSFPHSRDESFNYANEVKPGKKERDEKSSKLLLCGKDYAVIPPIMNIHSIVISQSH